MSTRWVLVIYPILARTRIAFDKRVSSGASFNRKKTSNYLTRKFEQNDHTSLQCCQNQRIYHLVTGEGHCNMKENRHEFWPGKNHKHFKKGKLHFEY